MLERGAGRIEVVVTYMNKKKGKKKAPSKLSYTVVVTTKPPASSYFVLVDNQLHLGTTQNQTNGEKELTEQASVGRIRYAPACLCTVSLGCT